MTLTTAEIEQFHQDGYVFPVDILGADEVAGIRSQLEKVEADNDGKLLPAQRSKGHLLFKWLEHAVLDQGSRSQILCRLAPGHQVLGPFQRQGRDGMAGAVTGQYRGRVHEGPAGVAPGRRAGAR